VNSVGTLPTVVIMSLQVRLSLRLAGDGCGALYGVTFTLFAGDNGTLKRFMLMLNHVHCKDTSVHIERYKLVKIYDDD
jgi:hypothetical protein